MRRVRCSSTGWRSHGRHAGAAINPVASSVRPRARRGAIRSIHKAESQTDTALPPKPAGPDQPTKAPKTQPTGQTCRSPRPGETAGGRSRRGPPLGTQNPQGCAPARSMPPACSAARPSASWAVSRDSSGNCNVAASTRPRKPPDRPARSQTLATTNRAATSPGSLIDRQTGTRAFISNHSAIRNPKSKTTMNTQQDLLAVLTREGVLINASVRYPRFHKKLSPADLGLSTNRSANGSSASATRNSSEGSARRTRPRRRPHPCHHRPGHLPLPRGPRPLPAQRQTR